MALTDAVEQLNNKITAIADSLREATGKTGELSLDDMPTAISGLGSGGGDTTIEDGLITRTLTEYTNNRVETVGKYLFQNLTTFTKATFNNAKTIEQQAFSSCSNLTQVSIPKVTKICYGAFQSCQKLELPELPSGIVTIEQNGFTTCSKCTVKNFPITLTTIGNQAFQGCYGLTEVIFNSDVTFGTQVFYNSINIEKAYFGGKTTLGNNTFYGVSALKEVEFANSNPVTIPAQTFYNCTRLVTLILRSTTLSPLSATSAFTNTPIVTGLGYVYVDDSLIDSYKTATNWSTYANKIKGISELGVTSIEIKCDDINKVFTNQTTVNLTYNGGASEVYLKEQMGVNWSITGNATIDENGVVTLSNNAQAGDTITITATSKYNNNITATTTISVTDDPQYYSVDLNFGQWVDSGTTVDGHTVYKSDAGSFNVNNGTSTATITVAGYTTFKIYIRSYAEGGFDYTEAFAVDTTASRGRGLYTTKSKQSATVYTECAYTLDGGIHTIQIMYSKDSSGNTSDDRGYFYIAGGE